MSNAFHKWKSVTFKGSPLSLIGKGLKAGDEAPSFVLTTSDLKDVSLKDFKDKVLVICAVPSIDTPVCDLQGKRFNEEAKKLGKDVKVVIVSLDTPFAQARWQKEASCLNVDTLSDYKNREFALNYGLLIDELKLLSRSVIIIGKDSKVKYVEYVDEITHEPNYDQAIEALKKL
jgi:thiol peroxidase